MLKLVLSMVVASGAYLVTLGLQGSDGPFFLAEHDESTRVKAMARSLKTPDSGLGPGLYETAPSSFFRHPPQVVIGE